MSRLVSAMLRIYIPVMFVWYISFIFKTLLRNVGMRFQIRENLMRINNIDSILEETRGNKTIAAALQNSAESASQRAAEIR